MRGENDINRRGGEARAAQFRSRLRHFRSERRRSVLGLPEIVALGFAALLLLAAVGAYLLLLRPQRVRAAQLELERETLQQQLQSSQGSLRERQDTQASVREILTSLEQFETEHLTVAGSGSTGVIEELHRLLRKNGIRISGGMSYTQLQEVVPGAEPDQQRQQTQRSRAEQGSGRVVQSVFPGVGVTLTVEGPYTNLRRFIRDVEASRHFIVVSTVELEGITESGALTADTGAVGPDGAVAPVAPAAPVTTRGRLVSLRLDMAAYFRRSAVAAGEQQ